MPMTALHAINTCASGAAMFCIEAPTWKPRSHHSGLARAFITTTPRKRREADPALRVRSILKPRGDAACACRRKGSSHVLGTAAADPAVRRRLQTEGPSAVPHKEARRCAALALTRPGLIRWCARRLSRAARRGRPSSHRRLRSHSAHGYLLRIRSSPSPDRQQAHRTIWRELAKNRMRYSLEGVRPCASAVSSPPEACRVKVSSRLGRGGGDPSADHRIRQGSEDPRVDWSTRHRRRIAGFSKSASRPATRCRSRKSIREASASPQSRVGLNHRIETGRETSSLPPARPDMVTLARAMLYDPRGAVTPARPTCAAGRAPPAILALAGPRPKKGRCSRDALSDEVRGLEGRPHSGSEC